MKLYHSATVHCPNCGDVQVPVEEISLALADLFWWSTICPGCGSPVYGRTNDGGVVSGLVGSGAKVTSAGVAEEAADWLARATS